MTDEKTMGAMTIPQPQTKWATHFVGEAQIAAAKRYLSNPPMIGETRAEQVLIDKLGAILPRDGEGKPDEESVAYKYRERLRQAIEGMVQLAGGTTHSPKITQAAGMCSLVKQVKQLLPKEDAEAQQAAKAVLITFEEQQIAKAFASQFAVH